MEDYLGQYNIIERIKTTEFYNNFISYFNANKEMLPAVFNIVRYSYFDVSSLNEIQKQIYSINPIERIMFQILRQDLKISRFYVYEGIIYYSPSIESNRKDFSRSSDEFKVYTKNEEKFNQKRDNVYLTVLELKNINETLYLEHNQPLCSDEINKLIRIQKDTSKDIIF